MLTSHYATSQRGAARSLWMAGLGLLALLMLAGIVLMPMLRARMEWAHTLAPLRRDWQRLPVGSALVVHHLPAQWPRGAGAVSTPCATLIADLDAARPLARLWVDGHRVLPARDPSAWMRACAVTRQNVNIMAQPQTS